jgi:hypothetical protein
MRAYDEMQTALRVVFLCTISFEDIAQRLKWDSTSLPPLEAYETELTTSTLSAQVIIMAKVTVKYRTSHQKYYVHFGHMK